jgi:plastocyanin
MVAVPRVVWLGMLTVTLIGCAGAPPAPPQQQAAPPAPPQQAAPSPVPVAKASAVAKTAPAATPAEEGELVQIGQIMYANWGSRDARDDDERELNAGDFYFKGTFLEGEPGQELTLEIQNVAEQVHNISLPAQGIDRDISPKSGRVNVEVTFPVTGVVQFFCKYHTARGMNGLLVVGDLPPLSAVSASPIPSPQPAR